MNSMTLAVGEFSRDFSLLLTGACVLITLVIWNAGAGEMEPHERLLFSGMLTLFSTALAAVILHSMEGRA